MDANDLMKILKESEAQLNQILSDCKNGPSELVLLASKMDPLLTNFSALEAELLSSVQNEKEPAEHSNDAEA